jgi:hypothetical protein
MGTYPRKLFANYRDLVTEDDARAWFSILRTGAGSVIPTAAVA